MQDSELAFGLIRAALNGETLHLGATPPDTDQWWSIFRLLQRNHMAAMCFDAAADSGAPRKIAMPWVAEREKTADWHRYQRQVQDDIVDTMARHGIITLVLKGTHTAQYYPHPEYRPFGDLDLYFYNRHEDADRIATEILKVTVDNEAHHHTKYTYRNVVVESHYDFVNVHYPPSNRRYEAMLKELAPSPTFEVLFLLRHMAGHFAASRITLRDLADWTLTCQALQEQVDWKMVQHTVDEYGMTSFTAALANIANRHLGIDAPQHAVTTCAESGITGKVEHDIVYGTAETDDSGRNGLARLPWKLRRWKAQAWKRRMVFRDSETSLLWASLTSHAEKPKSILHKM